MIEIVEKLGVAIELHQQGRLDEAGAVYGEILVEEPNHADALHLSGVIEHQRGQHENALSSIEMAIAADCSVVMYHANRARVLRALGRPADATDAARAALNLEPDNAETLCELAGALLETAKFKEALTIAIKAYQLAPDMSEARENLAHAQFSIGQRYQNDGDLTEAETHFRGALETDSTMLEALVNLGNVYRLMYRLGEARACYKAAITRDANIAEVHGNLGVVLQEMGESHAAIESYGKALAMEPKNAEIRRNRAQALLKIGQFDRGWREFEWRWQTAHFAAIRREWEKPRWDGRAVEGSTVLVHAEQGFGDTLQFARYLPMVAERGAKVVVECPSVLADLISHVDCVSQVVDFGTSLPPHDFQIPMMSLPLAFGIGFSNMLGRVPYLSVSDERQREWGDRLDQCEESTRIGLVWKGSENHQRNAWRSPGLEVFKPLLDVEGMRWFSLQKDGEALDLEATGVGQRVVSLGADFADFTDTAAAILNLDLVVSADTAVAHLAGALGRPVWLVLPYANEWRWFEGRKDSPWYPTMRLFHQSALGDWEGAIAAVAAGIEKREY